MSARNMKLRDENNLKKSREKVEKFERFEKYNESEEQPFDRRERRSIHKGFFFNFYTSS